MDSNGPDVQLEDARASRRSLAQAKSNHMEMMRSAKSARPAAQSPPAVHTSKKPHLPLSLLTAPRRDGMVCWKMKSGPDH